MAEANEVIDILGGLMDAFPNHKLNNPKGYFEMAGRILAGVEAGALQMGVDDLIASSKFFPSISEIKNAAMQARRRGHSMVEIREPVLRPEILRARGTQYLADKNPITWTEDDHATFERWYGHPVFWKGAPIDTGERCPKCGTPKITFHDCAVVCSKCGYVEPPIRWVFTKSCAQTAIDKRSEWWEANLA